MRKFFTLVFLCNVLIYSKAYDFKVNDIYYDSLSSKTCEVVLGGGYQTESIIIPRNVTFKGNEYEVVRISSDAFYAQTAVKSIYISDRVSAIGNESFMHCCGLVSINVEDGNPVYSSYNGALYNKKQTKLIKVPTGKTEFNIPSSVNEIGEDAFHLCRFLKKIIIPSTVTYIGDNAFAGCDSLQEIDIPNSVVRIGDYSFAGCKALVSLLIPNSVKEIGKNAISFCTSLKTVKLSSEIKTIPDGLFKGCTTLQTVNIPYGITTIGNSSFAQCDSLQTIQIPNTVISLGSNVFQNCSSLRLHEIPKNVTMIGNQALEYCLQLDTIAIPGRVSVIGDKVFNGCKGLTYIVVSEDNEKYKSLQGALYDYNMKLLIKAPSLTKNDSIYETVTTICPYAFFNCVSLSAVKIPESVAYIGKWAFVGCSALDSVYMTKPVDLKDTYLPDEIRTLYVPIGKKSDFESSNYYLDQYSLFKSIEEYGEATVSITKPSNLDYNMDATAIYNLFGVRIQGGKEVLSKGLYLIGGKKIIIK